MVVIKLVPLKSVSAYRSMGFDRVWGVDTDADYRVLKAGVDAFIRLARKNPQIDYWVHLDYNSEELPPMFDQAPVNVILPKKWENKVSTQIYKDGELTNRKFFRT